jgi:hypothetical protein
MTGSERMEEDYLNRNCTVRLVTGEELPENICYWGKSPLGEDLIWFGVPKAGQVLETELEFHVPKYTIVSIVFK